jgi:hypothetical protein
VKEGVEKETREKFVIKIIDKKDAVFDSEPLEKEVYHISRINLA